MQLATSEWVLSLDADERVSKDLREDIIKELKNPRFEVYQLPRQTQFCGQWIWQFCRNYLNLRNFIGFVEILQLGKIFKSKFVRDLERISGLRKF